METVVQVFIDILILPLQAILIPVDALLKQIPGIEAIPQAISGVTQFIGAIPETMVYLFNINPFIWNSLFLTFVLYLTAAPAIQMLKKIWAWIRP